MMSYDTIIVEVKGSVGLITLSRPKALNAINDTLMNELGQALHHFDSNDEIGAIVLTGNEKAFAAGADIKEMAEKTFADCYLGDFISKNWEEICHIRKPVIAAVSGYALGGGNELAMMCDFILASDSAKFGQPEITLGIIPGAGGTQRLTKAIGKAKAMEMILTGRMMTAIEAEQAGLVSRIVPADQLIEEAIRVGERIASMGRPSVIAAKEAVNRAFESHLAEGVRFERLLFQALFSTEDQKEGMASFLDKRQPTFHHR
jgi:enoyl-CoA hydratase